MDNTKVTPFFKAKNHNKISGVSSYATMNIVEQNELPVSMSVLEDESVVKAKRVLANSFFTAKQAMQVLVNLESLKEAMAKYVENHPANIESNIKTTPTFFEPRFKRIELSESVSETFARIGERARRSFIEEQTARAFQYNIPVNLDHVNFLELEQQIDEYEELLEVARTQGIYWDIDIYDPLALRQAIDEQEVYDRQQWNDLYASFETTRGLEV